MDTFLELIPYDIFKRYLNYEPLRTNKDLAAAFTELASTNVKIAKAVIGAYVREMKAENEKGNLMPATMKNRLKPIKKLLKANDVEISWYLVDKSLPKIGKSKDRAYTRLELQNMITKAIDITDKVIITSASSGGFRVEAWNYFTWGDLVIFYNDDGTPKGGALRVYHGDIEEYWTHITPEACSYFLLYRETWKARFMNYPKPTDPLLAQVRKSRITRLGLSGVKARVTTMATAIGLRPPLENGKRRHEVMIDHGMRKYQNTMFRRAKVDFADKEEIQGRGAGGQEGSYGRYVEADFERFPEYQKAIPFLTISDDERNKFKLQQKQQKIDELQAKTEKIDKLENMVMELREEKGILASEDTKELFIEILKEKNLIK